jgi:hypothetical protein
MTDLALNRRDFVQLVAAAGVATALTAAESHGRTTAKDSADDDVVELVDVLGMSNSLVELKDGSLLANDGRRSNDGGLTWTAPAPFDGGAAGTSLFRLKSGKLALVAGVGYSAGRMWISADEGATWMLAGSIQVPGGPIYELGDTMIQLESGRLLYCWDYNMTGAHPELKYEDVTRPEPGRARNTPSKATVTCPNSSPQGSVGRTTKVAPGPSAWIARCPTC